MIITEENLPKLKEQISIGMDIFIGGIDYAKIQNSLSNIYVNGVWQKASEEHVRDLLFSIKKDILNSLSIGDKASFTKKNWNKITVKLKSSTKKASINLIYQRWRGEEPIIDEIYEFEI
jgi:hypothetical protein